MHLVAIDLLSKETIEVQSNTEICNVRLELAFGLGLQCLHELREIGVKYFTVSLNHPLVRFVVEFTLYSSCLLFDAVAALLLILSDDSAQLGPIHGRLAQTVQVSLNEASLLVSSDFILFVLQYQ